MVGVMGQWDRQRWCGRSLVRVHWGQKWSRRSLVEIGGGGHAVSLVLWLWDVPGGIRKAVSETGIYHGISAIPCPEPMELCDQVFKLLVFILKRVVLEANCFGLNFLCRAAQCFIFRVRVIRGSRVVFCTLIVGDLTFPFTLRSAPVAVRPSCVMVMGFIMSSRA